MYYKKQFYVYITTNPNRKVLYIGVTNNIIERIKEHYLNRGNPKTFAGRYHCYCLLYFEVGNYIDRAIERETELKGWLRKKKEELINKDNPDWRFLNEDIMKWPPDDDLRRGKR
jgi:putative endonuclease